MPQGYVLEIIVRPSKKEVPAPTLQKAQSAKPPKETSNPLPPLEMSPIKKTMSTKSETNSIVSLDMPPVKKQKKPEQTKVKKTVSVPPENKPTATIMPTMASTMPITEPQMPTTSSMAMKQAQAVHAISETMKTCFNILQKIRAQRSAQPFLFPPNIVAPGIADFMMSKETMDLTTIEHKLRSGEYSSPDQFNNDIRKIWFNARSFYPPGSDMNKMATEMSAFFENLIKEAEPPINPPPAQEQVDIEKKLKKLSKQTSVTKQKGGVQPVVDTKTKFPILKEVALTLIEKRNLYQNVNKLPPQYLKGVWDIVSEDSTPVQKGRDVIEFDLDNLSVDVSRKLERYVKFHTTVVNKNEQTYHKAQEQFRNPMTNPIGNPLANIMTNSMVNQMTNPMVNPMANPMTNPMTNPMVNPLANPLANAMVNPMVNPMANPMVNPMTNPMGSFPVSIFML